MATVFFHAQDGTTKVRLDSEASISVSLPSMVSKSSNMNGVSVSDDVIEGNAVISVEGRVTYSKLKSQEKNLDPIQFQEALQDARRNRNRFTLYARSKDQPLLQNYDNCVIANVDITVDKYSDTITVSLTFEQVFVSLAAKKVFLAAKSSESAKPTTESPKITGQAGKAQVGEDAANTMVRSIELALTAFFGDTKDTKVDNK